MRGTTIMISYEIPRIGSGDVKQPDLGVEKSYHPLSGTDLLVRRSSLAEKLAADTAASEALSTTTYPRLSLHFRSSSFAFFCILLGALRPPPYHPQIRKSIGQVGRVSEEGPGIP
jgi:hypothetical protein